MSDITASTPDLPPLLGESAAFRDMLAHVSRVAPLDRPVLVVGERGTGKELVAARLNYLSPRLAEAGRCGPGALARGAFDVATRPPLRERPGDVKLLAEHFARAMSRELGRDRFAGFTARADSALASYAWPGNVRELRNVVERAGNCAVRPERPLDEITIDPLSP